MGWEAPWHWVVLAVVVIALFGYKKLPDASRALGRSLRIFKAELKGMSEDDQPRASAPQPGVDVPAVPVIPPAPVQQSQPPAPQPAPTSPAPSLDKPAAGGQ